tara:strand:+ start:264 stop:1238 length:975 start_codon:yes stop_codon:yes gene_type:complete
LLFAKCGAMSKLIKKDINVVIIGAGYMAEEYIRVIKSFKNLKTYGIYSRTNSKAKNLSKKYKIKKIFNSIKELRKDKKIDILIISVSAENNNKICKSFLDTKFLILLEKPIGLNIKEATKLINLVKKYKSRAFVALNRRFYDSTLDLKNRIKKNKGNRIIEVFDSQNKDKFKKLKKNKKVINSLMYANSVHLIDYMDVFCRGKLKQIITIKSHKNNPSIVTSKLKFSSGDIAFYHATWNRQSRWKVKVLINKAEYVLQPLETLKCFNTENNKLIFSKTYKSKLKDGLVNMINHLKKEFERKKNDLIKIDKHASTINIINKIYEK